MSDWSLDHLVIGTSNLEGDMDDFEKNLMCRPVLGGTHPSLGTKNALIGISGSKTYLEILGPDPSNPDGPGSKLLNLHKPALRLTPYHFAIRTSNLEGVKSRARTLGLEPKEIQKMSRKSADGSVLTWKWLFLKGHGLGGLIPFFVDWSGSKHPSESLSKNSPEGKMCLTAKVVIAGPGEYLGTPKALLEGVDGIEFEESDICGLFFPIGISDMEGGLITISGFQPEGIDFEESKSRDFKWTAK